MSLDPRAGVPSAGTDPPAGPDAGPDPAAVAQARGEALLDGLERHLPGSRRHADGTASYALAIAVELGADRGGAELAREAARLHDVGKVYIPAAVLARPTRGAGEQELALLDSYPSYGATLAIGAGIPERACEWIAGAGECFDGSAGTGWPASAFRSRAGSSALPVPATRCSRGARRRRGPCPGWRAPSFERPPGASSTRGPSRRIAAVLERAAHPSGSERRRRPRTIRSMIGLCRGKASAREAARSRTRSCRRASVIAAAASCTLV